MRYLKTEGNLAIDDESLPVLQKPKDKTLSPALHVVQDIAEEYPEGDVLSPAKGTIGALGLSVILWRLITLAIYWIHLNL